MMEYRIAGAKDLDGIIDFANMVFFMLRVPHNFEQILPKVYAAPHLKADIHVIAEEEGRLCGCLGMLVFPLRVAGETLQVGYLGTMSVHPRVRGRGTMGTLMQKQMARAREMGLDMVVLGGQRQRYGNHGFETCGATFGYSISAANVRHAMTAADHTGLKFVPMAQEDVPFALALYDGQAVAGARTPENFLDAVRSYGEKPYILLRGEQKIGYVVTSKDGQRISELVMASEEDILPAIKGYMQQMGVGNLRVDAMPHDTALNGRLASLCEGFTISANCMLHMLKPDKVIAAYMKLKAGMQPLADGELVLSCGEAGTVKIAGSGGEISTEMTQEAAQPLTGAQAAMLLFGYNRFAAPKVSAPLGWFPLPFAIAEPDSF